MKTNTAQDMSLVSNVSNRKDVYSGALRFYHFQGCPEYDWCRGLAMAFSAWNLEMVESLTRKTLKSIHHHENEHVPEACRFHDIIDYHEFCPALLLFLLVMALASATE